MLTNSEVTDRRLLGSVPKMQNLRCLDIWDDKVLSQEHWDWVWSFPMRGLPGSEVLRLNLKPLKLTPEHNLHKYVDFFN